ncbi:hypothetical protein AB6A40_002988 [Gnathostoma spinigerum]|uniref:Uncharacterized protein n=1 Tax=Gnathostoma spinigerum TaxID=75299 RepID=A0ABD6EG07_9BILA
MSNPQLESDFVHSNEHNIPKRNVMNHEKKNTNPQMNSPAEKANRNLSVRRSEIGNAPYMVVRPISLRITQYYATIWTVYNITESMRGGISMMVNQMSRSATMQRKTRDAL